MNRQPITVSLALIVLICFFLPWIQVSCGTSSSRLTGVDIARDGHTALWIIPLLMLAVLILGLAREWREKRPFSAAIALIAGLVSTYLMNRERLRAVDTSGVLAVSLTGWFWLGLISALALTFLSLWGVLKPADKTP
ncbi:MAG TPA: hypothetical protein VK208_05450 [Pyrinomonadaceae bacterium]|jgi:hypothetical protein|nr:hypothetical protein [Pyrinomonadaceae bacterium]